VTDARSRRLAILGVPAVALAASLAVRFVWWWRREYCHDDFMILSWAWLRSQRERPSVERTLALYTPLTEFLAPLFRLFPDSFVPIDAGRGLVLAAGLALLLVSFGLARRLGASLPAALGGVSLASWQPDLQLRLADVRNDPFAALALLAGASLLAGGATPAAVGAAAGMAILFSVKYALACPFLAIALVARDRTRPIRALGMFGCGVLAVVGAFVLFRFAVDGKDCLLPWKLYLATGGMRAAGHPFLAALGRSPLTFVLVAAGAAGWCVDARRASNDARRGATYAIVTIAFLTAFVAINPFFFPYNNVLVVPLLVPVAAGLERLFPTDTRPRWLAALVALLTLVPVLEGIGASVEVANRSNERQRRVLRWLWTATSPEERAFDNSGMHLFRNGIPHWYTYAGQLPAYWAGRAFSFEAELRASPVHVVIWNDLLKAMTPKDQMFLQSRFVPAGPSESCILIPGARLDARVLLRGPVAFEIVTPGLYDARGADGGPASIRVDGVSLESPRLLGVGWHEAEIDGLPSDGGVVLGLTTARRRGVPLPCPEPEPERLFVF